ncbi:hypothetical protein HK104_008538 [Borealophlyctis nickersoniae]|nr:hypothetical protein HK104_008538 [Borealophlyctis nickersoniae]
MTAPAIDPSRWAAFSDAVRLVFSRWTALQLALDHQMAGTATETCAKEMYDHTLSFFREHGTEVYPDELCDNYKGYFDEVFNAELEDGSPEQVGKALVSLYAEIMVQGKMDGYEALKQKAASGRNAALASTVVGDDSSDDEDEEGGGEDREAMEIDGGAGTAPASAAPSRPPPVIDEDGFELVQPKKGRRRN